MDRVRRRAGRRGVQDLARSGPLLSRVVRRIVEQVQLLDLHASVRLLGHVGPGATFGKDLVVIGGDRIWVGRDVRVGRRARLQTITASGSQRFEPRLVISDRVSIEDDCHIGATRLVEIGPDVMIAGGVFISDHRHGYEDVTVPVSRQPLVDGVVHIGAGSHIGENVCVLGPLRIGEHVVVGANAVVTRDVPDRTVVAGAPARVVRRYDAQAGRWVRA